MTREIIRMLLTSFQNLDRVSSNYSTSGVLAPGSNDEVAADSETVMSEFASLVRCIIISMKSGHSFDSIRRVLFDSTPV